MNIKNTIPGFLTVALAAALLTSAASASETLDSTFAAVRGYNPQMRAAGFGVNAAAARVDQAKAAFMPTITATGSYGLNRYDASGVVSRTNEKPLAGGVSLSLPLYTGGKLTAQLDQAKAEGASADDQRMLTEQSVLLNAANTYLNVVRADTQLHLAQAQQSLLERELEQVQTELRAGIRTKTDVAQTQSRLSAAEAGVRNAQANVDTASYEFQAIAGRLPEGDLELPQLAPPADRSGYLDNVRAGSPEVRLAMDNVAASQAGRRVARAAYAPTLSLQAGISHDQAQNPFLPKETNRTVGIQLTIPLYTGGMASAVRSEAEARYAQSQAQTAQVNAEIESKAASTWAQLRSQEAQMEARNDQVNSAETALEGARQELKAGSRTVLDVLNAEQELLDARVELVNTTIDRVGSIAQLQALAGALGRN